MKHRLLPLLTILAGFLTVSFIPAADPAPPDKPVVKHGLGYKQLPPEKEKQLHDERFKEHGYRMAFLVKNATPPAEFDVKDMGWAGDIGDQAQCGSCYLCSTMKTATCAAVKAGLGKVDQFSLSWQYGMDCHDFGGCNGGNGTEVIDWMTKNGWPAEADPSQPASALYPSYSAQAGQCRLPANAKMFKPKNWLFITSDQGDHPATADEYKAALLTYGRVNVALDAGGQFSAYQSGVITQLGSSIDHEINVRGYSDAKQALLLENQWGNWGGAKSPGDGCAWLSYKAVSALQDPFCVVFDAPQPPPVPPGPGPNPPPPPPGPTPTPGQYYTKAVAADGSETFTPAAGVVIPADLAAQLKAWANGTGTPKPPPDKPKPDDRPMPKPEPEALVNPGFRYPVYAASGPWSYDRSFARYAPRP